MYDFKDKETNVKNLTRYMLAKTLSMFEYYNLPESIPYRELELLLQSKGYAFITEHKGKLYAFTGGLGGEPDAYGNPTTIIIANPHLKLNTTFDLEKDGVLIRNDDMMMGLLPLYNKANTLLIENDINMVLHGYNSRLNTLISAPDDKTKESANLYLEKIIDGELGIIGDNAMFDGIKVHNGNSNNSNPITNLIEYQQYIKATMHNEIGLSANFNMKRERLNTEEVDQGKDGLFPFVYNMMKCRLKGIEKLNEKYNLKLDIDFGSVWHVNNKEFIDDINQNDAPESITGNTEGDPEGEPTTSINKESLENGSEKPNENENTEHSKKEITGSDQEGIENNSEPSTKSEEPTEQTETANTSTDSEKADTKQGNDSNQSEQSDQSERANDPENETESDPTTNDPDKSEKREEKEELNEKENEPKDEPKDEPKKDDKRKAKRILRKELLKQRKKEG